VLTLQVQLFCFFWEICNTSKSINNKRNEHLPLEFLQLWKGDS